MITKYTKPTLKIIRAKMAVALGSVEDAFGIKVDVGSASYTDYEVTFKVKLSIQDTSGDNKQDKADFLLYGVSRGFDAEDFGKNFTHRRGQFRITGWNRRRWKLPVVTKEISTGRIAYFPVNAVLRVLGKADKVQHSFDLR